MLELYHAEPGANSLRPLIVLKEKGIDFVSHYVNLLLFEQHAPAFVAINPNGQVPALVHDGELITESAVIGEYLDDVFHEVALRPHDNAQRARMRIWTKFCDEYFNGAVSMLGWHGMVRRIAQNIDEDQLEAVLSRIPLKEQRDKWATIAGDSFTEAELAESRRRIEVSVAKMEAILARSEWLAGPTYSLADINTLGIAGYIPRMMPELMNDQATPGCMRWLAEINARPGVQAALAMPNRLEETFKALGV